MGFKTPVHDPVADPTAWIQMEDESLSTNKAAVAIPFLDGEGKTTARWITPIYGQNVIQTKSGGGKGGKGGGGTTTTTYRGTIAGAFGIGPAWSIEWAIYNGVRFQFNLAKPDGVDFSTLSFGDFGTGTWYWGTETQIADPVLSAYAEQSGRRGKVYLVLNNCSFGSHGETQAPTIQIGWRRIPQQDIIVNTLSSASNDGAFTANAITVAAEYLTAWDWAGLPSSALNGASFQATADVLQAMRAPGASDDDDTNRPPVAIAPLWNERVTLKTALIDLSRIAKAWFRYDQDGKIEAGYWRRDGVYANASALTPADCTEVPQIEVAATDRLPNSFVVEFTDSTRHHKSNCITVNNTAKIRNGTLRRQTVKYPMLLRDSQARIAAAELLRDAEAPTVSITLVVRRSKARNVDETAIRPGDYFSFPIQLLAGAAADPRVFRCTRREFEPFGPITLFGELETNGELATALPVEYVAPDPVPMPSAGRRRILPICSPDASDAPPIFALAARPSDTATGMLVSYGRTETGDFQQIGTQVGFSLPVSLVAAVASDDSTVRVKLLASAEDQRDAHLLRDWQGGATEGADDQLLLMLIAKDGAGAVTAREILSVNGPATVVDTDTFDVPVLRGRQGTTALAFDSGTFPDVWTNYEGWITPREQLTEQTHSDFVDLAGTDTPVYFRYTPFGFGQTYEPSVSDPQPTDGLTLPDICVGHPPHYEDLWRPLFGIGFAHRERGGTAELVGKNEPDCEASSPPKKYRTATRVGSYTMTEFDELGCPAGHERAPGDVYTYSGGDHWDVTTGAHTSDEQLTVNYNTGETVVTDIPLGESTPCPASNCDFTITTSPTGWTQTVTGACCPGGFFPQKASGEGTVLTLSDEDTEQNAIDRLIASVGDWGSWDSCLTWPCGMSKWTIRTTGFDFEYIQGQWKVSITGATPGAAIMVTITFIRTDLETSEVDHFILRYGATAAGDGTAELIGDLPIQRGFQIQVDDYDARAAS